MAQVMKPSAFQSGLSRDPSRLLGDLLWIKKRAVQFGEHKSRIVPGRAKLFHLHDLEASNLPQNVGHLPAEWHRAQTAICLGGEQYKALAQETVQVSYNEQPPTAR